MIFSPIRHLDFPELPESDVGDSEFELLFSTASEWVSSVLFCILIPLIYLNFTSNLTV